MTRIRLYLLGAALLLGLGLYLILPASLPYLLVGGFVLLHFGLHGHGGHKHGSHKHADPPTPAKSEPADARGRR